MLKAIHELFSDKRWWVRHHGPVIRSLKIVEGYVVVNAVPSLIVFGGKRIDSWIVVVLPAGYHLPIAVVSPDPDDVLRQRKVTVSVQLHDLAVEVGAADGVFVVLFYQVILHADDPAYEFATGFRGVISRIVSPEGLIPLASEANVPDHLAVRLLSQSILP